MTTQQKLDTRTGLEIGQVLAIEGYEYLLVSRPDTAAALAAWAGTPWVKALPGLEVLGAFEQSIEPWDNSIQTSNLSFLVVPEAGDIFGQDVFRTAPVAKTSLGSPFGTGDTTVQPQAPDTLPEIGTVYIGRSRVEYESITDGKLILSGPEKAGTHAPFGTQSLPSHHFPRPYRPGETGPRAGMKPAVSKEPRTWVGKWIGLWTHAVDGGVWDAKSDAKLEFAGQILDVEDTSDGTILRCEDVRGVVRKAMIGGNAWTANVAEGIYLFEGWQFEARSEFWEDGGVGGDVSTFKRSDPMVVVSGVPADAREIQAGRYTTDTLISAINKWLIAESAAGRLDGEWFATLGTKVRGGGRRFVYGAKMPADATHSIISLGAERDVLEHLGFIDAVDGDDLAWVKFDTHARTAQKQAKNPPFRVRPFQRTRNGRIRNMVLDVTDPSGTFYDVGLPAPLSDYVDVNGGEGWGIFRLGGNMIFAGHTDKNGVIDHIETAAELGPFPQDAAALLSVGITYDEGGEQLEVTQMVVLEGTLTELFARLFLSTDGNGTNHPTYDVLPWGAGIPWDLLGQEFLDSLAALEQSDDTGAMTIVVEKPTKLEDLILPELTLRYAWLIFRAGKLVVVSPPTPSVNDATYVLDETNKAVEVGQQNAPTLCKITPDYLFNVIKVQHGRKFWTDEYVGIPIEFRSQASIDQYGEQGTLSIKARNSYYGVTESAASVYDLASGLASRMMPVFGRPLRVLTRPISHQQFGIAAGDIVSVSDALARNPHSGKRGMLLEPATVLAVSHQYPGRGHPAYGEVTLLFSEEGARLFAMAPSARVLDYDAGTKTITLDTDGYSRGADPADVTYFAAGHKIRLIALGEVDDLGENDTLASVNAGASTAVLSSGVFAFDPTKTYVMVFDDFDVIDSDQADVAFQADPVTGLVKGSQDENTFGDDVPVSFSKATGEEPAALIPEAMTGDGRPLSTALLAELCRGVNQMIQHTTQPQAPQILTWTPYLDSAAFGQWRMEMCFPIFVGAGLSFPVRRKIRVSPWFYSKNAGVTVEVRISCSQLPPFQEGEEPFGAFSSTTFSTSSTTPIAPGAQEIDLVGWKGGQAFITVETRTPSFGDPVAFLGLAELTVGAPFLAEPSYPTDATSFAAAMQVPLGPSHYWHFDQASAGICPDLAGDAPLSPVNAPTQGIDATDLKSKVVRFDADSVARMVAADDTKVQVADESICVIWIGRLNSVPAANDSLFGKRTATAGWYVRMAASGIADWNVESPAGDDSANSPNFEAMVGDPIIMMFRHDRANNVCQASIWHDGAVVDGTPDTALLATDLTNNAVFAVGNFLFGASAADVAAVAVFQGTAAQGLSSSSLANLAESIGL